MKRRLGIQLLLVGALLFGAIRVAQAAGGDLPTPTPISPPLITGTTVLLNGGFEGGLLGWTPWFEDTGKPANAESLDYAVTPAFSVERNPLLVYVGEASLHIGRMYDPWHAGLKQIARVTPQARVRFCAVGRVYASNRDFGREASWAALNGHLQVGLAVGDQDWTSTAVNWSEPINPHDEWREVCAEADADASGQITVFTSANFRGVAAKHLDVWWDAARLIDAGSLTAFGNAVNGSSAEAAPLNVLLLMPTGNISTTTYRVVPAQLYAGPIITLALSQPLTTTLLVTVSVKASMPTASLSSSPPSIDREQTINVRPDATVIVTAVPSPKSSPSFSGTATPVPTHAEPTVSRTVVPIATDRSVLPAIIPTEITPINLRESEPLPIGGLLGLSALLIGGVLGALLLARRR